MRRRSRAGGKSAKSQRRKTAMLKHRNAPKARRRRGVSIAGQETVVARLTRERDEALLRETANSEILHLISKSPGDLELVFRTILEHATRICNAKFGVMQLSERDGLRAVALHDVPPAYAEAMRRNPVFHPIVGHPLDRVASAKQVVHILDARAEQRMRGWMVELAGARTLLLVPMLKDNELVGVISIYRQEVGAFTDKQIALLQNFAAQAVIAIENTRLLNELRGRTQELTEALEQRTATSEVLGVISSSPGELTSVFDTILANALRLCDADMGHVLRAEAGALFIAAMRGGRPEYAQSLRERGSWRPAPDSGPAQAMEQKKPVQIADLSQTSAYAAGGQSTVAAVELGGLRTVLDVPMIADEKAIGVIVIYRNVVRPFSDKQIALVENFAAQAVIAIENARLLNELRESLDRQTANSEVLSVISSSPGKLEPVFDALLANAIRICDATFGNLFLFERNAFRAVAFRGDESYNDYLRRNPVINLQIHSGVPLDRLANTRQVIHIPDLRTDQSYAAKRDLIVRLVEVVGVRTFLAVPMLKEGALIGSINMYRQQMRPLKQIALVKNFAAQAVIRAQFLL